MYRRRDIEAQVGSAIFSHSFLNEFQPRVLQCADKWTEGNGNGKWKLWCLS